METFPKAVTLKDGAKLTLKIMDESDIDDVIDFFQGIHDDDRLYLRMDTSNPENVKRRFGKVNYDIMFPIMAVTDDRIVGISTLYRASFGWRRNLGELRVVIDRKFQRRGLATVLTKELFFQALKNKLYKIQAELMDNQHSAIAAFERLGFRREATLKRHVTDNDGKRQDLIIMTLDVEELWYLMEDYVKTPDFRIH
jgi:RimJ/RimL family protein N-acetyltransferase